MRQLYKFFNCSNYYEEFTDRLEKLGWNSVQYLVEYKRIRKLISNNNITPKQRASAYEYMSHCFNRRIEIFNNQAKVQK